MAGIGVLGQSAAEDAGIRGGSRVDEVDCLRAAEQIRAPVLVLAAEKDVRMPIPVVRSVYDRAAGPKEFWVIPGEGHENRGFGQEFRDKIGQFLGKIRKGV